MEGPRNVDPPKQYAQGGPAHHVPAAFVAPTAVGMASMSLGLQFLPRQLKAESGKVVVACSPIHLPVWSRSPQLNR